MMISAGHVENRERHGYTYSVHEKKTNNIVQNLARIFKRAGYLENGNSIKLFLFQNHRTDSIENISLMFTWKFMYSSKFTGGLPEHRQSLRALRSQAYTPSARALPCSVGQGFLEV